MENRMLSIETKVNSAQKLAAVQNKPTNEFLFAGEINRIVNSINTLRNLLIVNQENVEALIAQSESIDLGDISGGEFIDILNQMELVAIGSSAFIVYTIDNVKYVQSFLGQSGNYGSSTGLTLTVEQFALIYQSNSEIVQLTEYNFYGTIKQIGSNPPFVYESKTNFPESILVQEISPGCYKAYFNGIGFTDKTFYTMGLVGIRPINDRTGRLVGENVGSFIYFETINSATGLPERGYLSSGLQIHIKHIL